jgi:hypothetical protein
MIKSEQINELAAALSKAQSVIKGAVKDANNPFFKSQYADLTSVWDACREALTKNGLSVIQCPEQSDPGGIAIETTLLHSSGQFITSRYVMPVKNSTDAQAVGSAITYARRYALSAMVGVAPADDDDSNNAAGKHGSDLKKESNKLPEMTDIDFQKNKSAWKEKITGEKGKTAADMIKYLSQHKTLTDKQEKEIMSWDKQLEESAS